MPLPLLSPQLWHSQRIPAGQASDISDLSDMSDASDFRPARTNATPDACAHRQAR